MAATTDPPYKFPWLSHSFRDVILQEISWFQEIWEILLRTKE